MLIPASITTVVLGSSALLQQVAAAAAAAAAPPPPPPPPKGPPGKGQYATYINFAKDILSGDDGLPPHPMQPLPYGQPTYPVLTNGNGREQAEAHVTYFEDKYWMHAATWGCGGKQMVYGRAQGNLYPPNPYYPAGDYGADGNCGIKTYSSDDFVNWKYEDFYQAPSNVANLTKPVVRYSTATRKYVMTMGNKAIDANFFQATAESPGGPWSYPPVPMKGENVAHDFDIAVGPDGSHYIVTDVWNNKFTSDGVLQWDLWVQKLTPDLLSTVGGNSSVLFRTGQDLWEKQGLTLEAVGFFYHDGYWYITWGETVQNGAGYVYYHYATNPLGPWTDGGFLTMDGCGAQNKGVNILPTAQGPLILAGMLGYRTGPTNYVTQGNEHNSGAHVWHADNQQATASSYFFPIEINGDHTLKQWTCPTEIKIPLAKEVAKQPERPIPYQLDCRIRNWQDVRATFDPPRPASKLQLPVWQKTDNLGPTTNAGQVLNGILNITVELTNGNKSFSWVPSNISWAPDMVEMDLGGAGAVKAITLRTNATNGCYGTMAEPKREPGTSYGATVKGVQGYKKSSKDAQLYVYKFK